MHLNLKNYYSGTSGLLLPVPNKLHYPEEFREASRLVYYASLMNSIEINSSFYKLPMASTITKWAAEVTPEFKFTFKLFKEITHQKGLAFDPAYVANFFQLINNVGNKKGCLLVQLPPSIRIGDFAQLRFLMSVLWLNDPDCTWKIVVEFRHSSLYCEEIYEILAEFDMGMVLHDKAGVASPFLVSNLDFVYLRFHGPDGNYRGTYTDELLYEYASYINDWLEEGKTVYVYFNNTMGNVHANLNSLKQLI